MNLHVMINEKFIKDFIEFINKNFKQDEHFFLITDETENVKYVIPNYNNIKVIKRYRIKGINFLLKRWYKMKIYINLFFYSQKSNKIFYHGLFNTKFIEFLYLFKSFLKKSYWGIWGADLYSYLERKSLKKRQIKQNEREDYIKRNFCGYITHIKGDYELAQKWYGAKGKYFDCFMFPSNLYKNLEINKIEKEYISIQVGNSAASSNNHFEIFKKLEKYKNENIKIYCPLSYGDKIYAEKVIKKAKEIFNEKFIPMTEFLEYQKYLEFLSQIDIAIFAHDRQQAVGNITSLLSLKKTVYLKEEVTTYSMLEELGVKVKSFNKLNNLKILEEKVLEKNKEIIKERFSEKRLIEDWKKIFED